MSRDSITGQSTSQNPNQRFVRRGAGVISRPFEVDSFPFSVLAGRRYTISVTGRSLRDPTLTVFTPFGSRLFNDDFRGRLNPRISFVSARSGTAVASVRGFGSSTGSYRITVRP